MSEQSFYTVSVTGLATSAGFFTIGVMNASLNAAGMARQDKQSAATLMLEWHQQPMSCQRVVEWK